MNRENILERRRLIGVIPKAFRSKYTVPGYLILSLFGEARSIVIRRSTSFSRSWIAEYKEAMTPRRVASTLQHDLGALQYCQPYTGETLDTVNTRTLENLGGILGSDRGDRDRSTDLLPPYATLEIPLR